MHLTYRAFLLLTISLCVIGCDDDSRELRQAKRAVDQGDYAGALPLLDTVIAGRSHAELAEAYKLRARVHVHLGNFQDAMDDISPYIDDTHWTLIVRAQAYYGLGDIERAMEDLNNLLLQDQTHYAGSILRGEIRLFHFKDPEASMEDWRNALLRQRFDPLALYYQGVALILAGKPCQAKPGLEVSFNINSSNPRTAAALVDAYVSCKSNTKDDIERAVRYGKEGCDLTQWQSARHLQLYARALHANGDPINAIEMLTRAKEYASPEELDDIEQWLNTYQSPSDPQATEQVSD